MTVVVCENHVTTWTTTLDHAQVNSGSAEKMLVSVKLSA